MTFDSLNALGKQRKPFLFISDFLAQNIEIIPLDELDSSDIEFCIDEDYTYKKHTQQFKKTPIKFDSYKKNLIRLLSI